MPQTRNSLLATCIAVVCRGLLTHPTNTCTTSIIARLCTIVVGVPTRVNVDIDRRYTGKRNAGMRDSIEEADIPEDLKREKLERNRVRVDEAVFADAGDTFEAFPSRLKRWVMVSKRR